MSALSHFLAARPNVRRVAPELYLILGGKGERLISHSLLLLDSCPLLIDAGMNLEDARTLSELKIVQRLHFTHMHLDHRVHQNLFPTGEVTVPAPEVKAFHSFMHWFLLSGLPEEHQPAFIRWRKENTFCSEIPYAKGCDEGDLLSQDIIAQVIHLPGHTVGHSGVIFPEHRAVLISDYDFQPFGPWYGNRSSSLADYRRSLLRLMDLNNIEYYITSHGEGILTPERFHEGAKRYLQLLEQRSEKIIEAIRMEPGLRTEELVGRGIFYPPRALSRTPVLWYFEKRMIELHLEELFKEKRCAKDSQERLFPL